MYGIVALGLEMLRVLRVLRVMLGVIERSMRARVEHLGLLCREYLYGVSEALFRSSRVLYL